MFSQQRTTPLEFRGKSFCFTGKLAELKRTQAERETRARGGLTTDTVNAELDCLVVGSIPATGWKFGDYGRKIEAAREMLADGTARPCLVSESRFMDALAQVPCLNAGAIDGKVSVITYSFVTPSRNAFDRSAVERVIGRLKNDHGCHVRVRVIPAKARNELFAGRGEPSVPDGYLVFELRVVKHSPIEYSVATLADVVSTAFESIEGIDGTTHWFERSEGSSDYIRLIRELPEDLRLPDL